MNSQNSQLRGKTNRTIHLSHFHTRTVMNQHQTSHVNAADIINIARRRQRTILSVAAGIFVFSILLAFIWPPTYRSTATILIEEQEIPQDIVRSTITSFADQRIEKIKQQVMTRANLLKLIKQYNLYESFRRRNPTEVVLKEFIDDIEIEVISAEVVDKRTGRSTKATIAFTLSYNGESAALSQKVANEITNLFLGENLKSRESQAREVTFFLEKETHNLSGYIEQLGNQIASFKQEADRALPELFELNMQLMSQTERELMDTTQRLTELEDQRLHLEGQLSIIKPHSPMITTTGERILDSEERLKALRAQYASSSALLSNDHPDIIKMKQEIKGLEEATGQRPQTDELKKRLSDEHSKIETLLEQYGDEHPDVVRTRKIIASLEREIFNLANQPTPLPQTKPENPAFIQVLIQLNSTKNEIEGSKASKERLQKKFNSYAARLERTSEIEPAYLELTRDRDNATSKYHQIRFKLFEAQVSQELEEQRKGERFSLIDPPSLPEAPASPNRPAILLLGAIVALVGGFGMGALSESMDHAIHSNGMIEDITQLPALGVIPFMPNEHTLVLYARKRKFLQWAGASSVIVLIVMGHFFWMPLDILWFVALRKLGLT